VALPSPVVSETIIAAPPPAPRIAVPVRAEPVAPKVISSTSLAQVVTETVEVRNSSSLTVEIVQSYLEQIIRELEPKSKTMAEALRNQAQLYRVEGNDIHFITSEWMKARFEKPQPRGAIHEVFGKVLGYGVSVHFLSEKSVSLPGASETPSGGGEERKVDEDSEALIKVAEELGGKVVK
jgi:hypothetical protein